MQAEARRVQITNKIIKQKIVHVHLLAKEFDVSEMTIRRDLNILAKDGLITRTHGGAIFNEEYSSILDYALKITENKDLKQELAEYAASLIKDGDTIAINTSTITSMIAPFIMDRKVTVITNALDVANTLSHSKSINLILVGGTFISKYRSFEGPISIHNFSQHTYDLAFIGTNGINGSDIYTGGSLESEAKKSIIKKAKKTYILAENSKWNLKGTHKIASLDEVIVITKNIDIDHPYILDLAV